MGLGDGMRWKDEGAVSQNMDDSIPAECVWATTAWA
jgi:hypothetical protein